MAACVHVRMFVCMHACVVRVCVCVAQQARATPGSAAKTCEYTCVSVCLVHVCVCVSVAQHAWNTHVYVCVHIAAQALAPHLSQREAGCVCLHIRMHTCTHAYIHNTCMHACMRIHTHTHTHTHTCSSVKLRNGGTDSR